MVDDEVISVFVDLGALNYSPTECMAVLGVTNVKDYERLWKNGGRDAYEIGAAKVQFAIDKKLLEMATKGDLNAIEKLEERRRAAALLAVT